MVFDKNVPLPEARASRKTYNLNVKEMQIGDSFALDGDDNATNVKTRAAVNASASYYGMKITSRKVLENGVWKLRFWRIS